jgi:hypothetical protein
MSICFNPTCAYHNSDTEKFCQQCGQTLLLADRYFALREIGAGGFGKTYLGIDATTPNKTPCAIKQFLPAATNDRKTSEELFKKEADSLRVLSHPQIPQFLDYFEWEGQQYIVQEYIPGPTLAQELAESGPFPETKIRELLREILPILEHLHSRNLIHRDIKPSNIIRRSSEGVALGMQYRRKDSSMMHKESFYVIIKEGKSEGKSRKMSVEIKNLDHLGLVAGIIDEIGIVEKVNALIGEKKTEKISAGKVVKAMILNGMGLVSSPLYIFKDFFEGKAAEHLLGQEIKAEYLNDDRLGRVLDKMYEVGLNQIFMLVVIEIIKKYELKLDAVHLDSSSFHVHGSDKNSGENQTIEITYGYSRDRRPDLKQFIMELICTADGDVPLWMKICSGNSSDQKEFGEAMIEFKKQLQLDSLMVADSAFYTQENLQISKEIKWLSRVPLKVKAANELGLFGV